jgi:hypothetical protein
VTPGADRQPSSADRPPVSRVGDELQERVDGNEDATPSEVEDVEREAFDVAQQKGWDKNVKD